MQSSRDISVEDRG